MAFRALASLLARFLLVMGAACAILAAADRIPAFATGATHGARVYDTIEEAQRAVGARLFVPAYYPDSLAWPPRRVEVSPGPPLVIAIRVSNRARSREVLVVCQSIGDAASPPNWLLPPLQQLEEVELFMGRHPARLLRLLTPGGRVVHDLSWTQGDRRFTLRYEGTVDDLLRMGRALAREGA